MTAAVSSKPEMSSAANALMRSLAANASCLNAFERGESSTIDGDTGYGAVTSVFVDDFVEQLANSSMPADVDDDDHDDDDDDDDDDDEDEDIGEDDGDEMRYGS